MFCLESAKEMPAQDEEVAEAKEENIGINNGWGPVRIIVEGDAVTGVEFKRCLSVFDSNHKFSPKYDENDKKIVPADEVLLSIGQSIEWGNMLEESKVELRRGNAAIADSLTLQTSESDIFVGGDVYTGPKFAIDAIAAGKEGADSLHRFVHAGQSLTLGRNRREFLVLDKDNVDYTSYDTAKREKVAHDDSKNKTFSDPRSTLTQEQVAKETKRCLECGVAHVDPNQCIGCGECTVRCKFDAITLSRVFDAKSFGYENIKPHAAKRAIGRKVKIAFNSNRDSLDC